MAKQWIECGNLIRTWRDDAKEYWVVYLAGVAAVCAVVITVFLCYETVKHQHRIKVIDYVDEKGVTQYSICWCTECDYKRKLQE